MRHPFLMAALAAATLGACKDTLVPDLNNPSVGGLADPTPSQLATLMNGVLAASRTGYGSFILDAEIIGRDAYNLDNADPRWVGELLISLDPGGFGGRHWSARYQSVRTAQLLVDATGRASALSPEQKTGTTGFALTMKAHELMKVYESRASLGLPVEVGATARDIMPILCADPALDEIAATLDEGYAALTTAGAEFVTELPSGFAPFDEPATFAEFNRALRAKVAIYQLDYAAALAALDASFLDPDADLELGVFHSYSTAAGDVVNPLYQDPASTNYRAHPSLEADAPTEGTFVDQRFTSKIAKGTLKTYQDVGSDLIFMVYEGLDSPIPIITNEELILLRAQANLGVGAAANLTQARADINLIRQRAGGFATTLPLLTVQDIEDELLVQKRYSLLFESPSRWVDMRYYGRLDELPEDLATHNVAEVFPIPTAESLARNGQVSCQGS